MVTLKSTPYHFKVASDKHETMDVTNFFQTSGSTGSVNLQTSNKICQNSTFLTPLPDLHTHNLTVLWKIIDAVIWSISKGIITQVLRRIKADVVAS